MTHAATDMNDALAALTKNAAAIAGVCNAEGNVFGLMPHPEHAVDELVGGSADGLKIFESMRAYVGDPVLG